MLALLAPTELSVASQAHRFMTWIEMDWKVVGREAVTKSRGADVLVFGDSMLKFGLAPPKSWRRNSGGSVYCLAVLDGKPASSYFVTPPGGSGGQRRWRSSSSIISPSACASRRRTW